MPTVFVYNKHFRAWFLFVKGIFHARFTKRNSKA
jgi:hypothetical protein